MAASSGEGEELVDILIRGLDANTVARLDARAAALGISRSEYLRRQLDAAGRAEVPTIVSADDLRRAARAARDLGDPDVMAAAWR
ncbi:MAG: type II toxin-antitoxin system VapB family antitoxin [Microcella sp.]